MLIGAWVVISTGVARAFPGVQVAHPEHQNEEENKKNLRKTKKNWSKFEEKTRKVEGLPTRECEAGYGPGYQNEYGTLSIEGFHVTSQQPNHASHAIHSRHVGFSFALSGIGKSNKICSHSLSLNLHKAKLHRSNNVINIYSLTCTASLTCSNKISKKLKHILLFFPGFSYTAPGKKNIQHGVGTKCTRGAYRVAKTLYLKNNWFYPTSDWFYLIASPIENIKGIFTDSNNIFLWHESEDINKKKLISKILVDSNFTFSSFA